MDRPNPFDFSDFGPPRRPTGPTPPPAGSSGQPPAAPPPGGGGFSTGFDPWANAPKTQRRRGQQDAFDEAGGGEAFGQSGRHDAFELSGALGGGTLATAGPPLVWFAVALALAVAGVVLALLSALSGGVLATALVGWLLAGPIAIGALALYIRVDTRRRTESIYSAPRWVATLYWAVLAACLIGIALGAWQIALWAGRQ
ncbi:MAG: hypothetical protein QOI28_4416 [Mycobacterium sp.]|nr:hypothetical protein [Mycobacterium sp.]